jgi:RND family efflux transporter MFP subunit
VPGTVISRTDSDIAAEVAGRIIWMAEVGDEVKEGEVLARLDDKLLLLEQAQHQANIAKWEASVTRLSRKLTRILAMTKKNAASKDQLDEVKSDLEIARQELVQAEVNLSLTEHKLSQTQVKAPFKALVVERKQSPGEYTSVGQDLIRVVDTSQIEVSVRAPLSAVPYINAGMQVDVKNKQTIKVESIRAIVPVDDARSRRMEVRVALNQDDFPIGSAVRVALPHSEFYQATTVPRDALVLRGSGTFVFRVDEDNFAQQVPVITGIGLGERIEITGELNAGQSVVVRGAERLRPGQEVRFSDAMGQ